jgi:hypothetical protein
VSAGASTARLAALTVLLGCVIVLLSQMVTGFTLVDETDSVIATVTLFEQHGVATALFALFAALGLIFAVATGSRPAMIAVIGMGVAILLVFLLIDLPDIGSTGMFNTPGAGNLDATGKASAGLWMQMVGGLVIVIGAVVLLRLDESQLRAIGPDRGPDRRQSGTSR